MRGRAYFRDDRVLYVGPDLPSVLHAHHAAQVCVSLSGPLRIRSAPSARWLRCDGAIIPPDVPHETDPPVALIATFWLDADAPEARSMVPPHARDAIRALDRSRVRALVPSLRRCWQERFDGTRAAGVLADTMRLLVPSPDSHATLDPRVARARDLLRAAPERRLAIGGVAAAVSLSPSRLACLFRSQLGVPVRRYLLWLRLRDAVQEMTRGATITQAAHAAGFADTPHLDRTFRRMLGFTPSAALHVSEFVQDAPGPLAYDRRRTGGAASWSIERMPRE